MTRKQKECSSGASETGNIVEYTVNDVMIDNKTSQLNNSETYAMLKGRQFEKE